MKIKFRNPKKGHKKTKEISTSDKIKNRRKIKLPNKIRLAVIGILIIILLASVISANTAYQKSETIQNTITTISYNQAGRYNYIVYLNESTVYEGLEILKLGDGVIFKQLVKNINASFTYIFDINIVTEISGTYNITGRIQTELWNKTFTIIPDKEFSFNGKTAIFTEQFPIDFVFYENITSQIEEETGVTVVDPLLVIQTDIDISFNAGGKISETLSPSLTVSLGKLTINIEEGSDNQDSDAKTKTEEIYDPTVKNERNTWTTNSFLILIIIMLFVVFTTATTAELSKIERQIYKIKKKYGEWIVETEKLPSKALVNILPVKSLEDLMKTSEELGKPVVYYTTSKPEKHAFYVFDDTIWYEYSLKV